MQQSGRRTRKMLKWMAILFGVAVVGLYVLLPVVMGVAAVWPARTTVPAAPEGFADVTLGTAEGETLAAWYRASEDGAAVIVLHGAGETRARVREIVEFLAQSGYGVLAVDLRGHGESSGRTNRLGWQGTDDVRAAVQYLEAQGATRIGGLGLSMGGEVLLGAASEVRELRAIVADGATRRSTAELLALPSERPFYRNFTARIMFGTAGLLSGDRKPLPLLESMAAAAATRFLFIAAGANGREVEFNELFAATLRQRAALWVAPKARHTQAFTLYPNEYRARVLEFFSGSLGI